MTHARIGLPGLLAVFWCWALLGLSACSEADLGAMSEDANATALEPAGTLRVDIFPPAGIGSPQLLPQSQLVPASDYTGVALKLAPTITFQGVLTSEVASDWQGAVGVPTEREPLVATINATVPTTPLGASVRSAEDGSFRLELPAYENGDYVVSVLPEDAGAAPIFREERGFTTNEVWNPIFPLGTPVYGRVTDATGAGLANVPLRLIRTDAIPEVRSALFETDATGWYVARVAETGSYAIEVQGGPTSVTRDVVPTVRQDVLVEDEAGTTAFIDVGAIGDVDLEGLVVSPEGEPVRGATVRLRSTALGTAAGSLSLEWETDDSGSFRKRVLAGTYDVEVIPPYELAATAIPTTVTVSGAATDLGTLTLPRQKTLSGVVLDATSHNDPAPEVLVTATQVGFDHYVYSTTTADDGSFSLSLPDTDYEITFTPPSISVAGALTRVYTSPGPDQVFALEVGDVLDGTLTFEDKAVGWALLQVYDAYTGELVARGTTNEAGNFQMTVHVDLATETEEADTAAGADTGE